jgi:predicted RNA-binding protein YlqC (UPF0109 family)
MACSATTMLSQEVVQNLLQSHMLEQLTSNIDGLHQQLTIPCPKSMVGRVIGKGGETIKALQHYSGAMIQIDQSNDPTQVTIAGSASAVSLAANMVKVCGNR